MTVYACPKGHQSTEADFCDQCGSRISQNLSSGSMSSTPTVSTTGVKQPDCPDCGTAKDPDGGSFCEICGYNFITKLSGALPVAPPPPVPVSTQTTVQATGPWNAIVTVDPSLQGPDSPAPPTDFSPLTIALNKPTLLIGRTSATARFTLKWPWTLTPPFQPAMRSSPKLTKPPGACATSAPPTAPASTARKFPPCRMWF